MLISKSEMSVTVTKFSFGGVSEGVCRSAGPVSGRQLPGATPRGPGWMSLLVKRLVLARVPGAGARVARW